MISVVILTKNEQDKIADCLKSVSWADEIVIIDDNSTDQTVKIAKNFSTKVKVFQKALNGDFATQHNFGLEKAKGDWIFFVDADEIVSEPLRLEIKNTLENASSELVGICLKRLDSFMGKKLTHGETSRWKSVRLAKKGAGKWSREVHEHWLVKGGIANLKNPLLHFSHEDLGSFIKKINLYTDLDASHMVNGRQAQFELYRVFANPIGKFVQNYFFRLGFLDGFAGFVMAIMMSLYSLIVRIKLYEKTKIAKNGNQAGAVVVVFLIISFICILLYTKAVICRVGICF